MIITSWNVNSLNVRLPHVLEWLDQTKPDILALQETKLPDERFPRDAIEAAGYNVCFSGQKTYNGVAILSKGQAQNIKTDLVGLNDPQRRFLAASIDDVRILNVYIPNGQEVGSDKYAYKHDWLDALLITLKAELAEYENIVLLGDFNIAPEDIDIHKPERWRGKIMCSNEERAKFRQVLSLGFNDSVRMLQTDEPMYTWWDYRLAAFPRGWGLRIDHILTSYALTPLECGVGVDMRKKERPSDHAPVWLEL
ncbi:MAG: exodeoxyribonuclease III [Mariprofundaceae bacterium]